MLPVANVRDSVTLARMWSAPMSWCVLSVSSDWRVCTLTPRMESGIVLLLIKSKETNRFCVQAEDGIRYYKVTGVQTCALPISRVDPPPRARPPRRARASPHRGGLPRRGHQGDRTPAPRRAQRGAPAAGADAHRRPPARSEERRVGKEGRSRWAPDH